MAVLGLSFKPLTDDIRNSIAIELVELLKAAGAIVRAYDPQALEKAKQSLKGVKLCHSPYEACKGADCLLLATEWEEFKKLDLAKVKKLLRQPIVVDARNLYDPKIMAEMGFVYKCIGRGASCA